MKASVRFLLLVGAFGVNGGGGGVAEVGWDWLGMKGSRGSPNVLSHKQVTHGGFHHRRGGLWLA